MDDNQTIMEKIEESYKSMVIDNFGASVLQPQYFDKYVEYATRDTSILVDARQIIMENQVVNIDRTGFTGRILEPGRETAKPKRSKPEVRQERLVANELIADVAITDQALRRNIERDGYEDTLINMMGKQAGVDWESYAVLGNRNFGDTVDPLLSEQNGWIAKCRNHIYKDDTSNTGMEEGTVQGMLKAMLKKYPQEYRGDRRSLRYYLDSDTFDDYVEEVGERPTIAGDEAMTNYIARPYKGIEIREAPVLNEARDLTGLGQTAILVNPDNLVYGIFENVTIERDRNPRRRLTDFVLTMEVDQAFENPFLCVCAHPQINQGESLAEATDDYTNFHHNGNGLYEYPNPNAYSIYDSEHPHCGIIGGNTGGNGSITPGDDTGDNTGGDNTGGNNTGGNTGDNTGGNNSNTDPSNP